MPVGDRQPNGEVSNETVITGLRSWVSRIDTPQVIPDTVNNEQVAIRRPCDAGRIRQPTGEVSNETVITGLRSWVSRIDTP